MRNAPVPTTLDSLTHEGYTDVSGCMLHQLEPLLLDRWPLSDELLLNWFMYHPVSISSETATCVEGSTWATSCLGSTIGSGSNSDIRLLSSQNILPMHSRVFNKDGAFYLQNSEGAIHAVKQRSNVARSRSSAPSRSSAKLSSVHVDGSESPQAGTYINVCAQGVRPEYEMQLGDEFYVNGTHFRITNVESMHSLPPTNLEYFREQDGESSTNGSVGAQSESKTSLERESDRNSVRTVNLEHPKPRVRFAAMHEGVRFKDLSGKPRSTDTTRSNSSTCDTVVTAGTQLGTIGPVFEEETRYTPSVPIPPYSTSFKVEVENVDTKERFSKVIGGFSGDGQEGGNLTIGSAPESTVVLDSVQSTNKLLRKLPGELKHICDSEVYAHLDSWDGRIWLCDIGSSYLYLAAVGMSRSGTNDWQNPEQLEYMCPWKLGTNVKVTRDSPIGIGDVVFISDFPMQVGRVQCDGPVQSMLLKVSKVQTQISEEFLFQNTLKSEDPSSPTCTRSRTQSIKTAAQGELLNSQQPTNINRKLLQHDGQLRESVYLRLSNRNPTHIGKFLHGSHGSSALKCDDMRMSSFNAVIHPSGSHYELFNKRSGANHQLAVLQGRREVRGMPCKLNQGDIFLVGRTRFKVLNLKVDDSKYPFGSPIELLRNRKRRVSHAAVKLGAGSKEVEGDNLGESEPLMCVPVVIRKQVAQEQQEQKQQDGEQVEKGECVPALIVPGEGDEVDESSEIDSPKTTERSGSWHSFKLRQSPLDKHNRGSSRSQKGSQRSSDRHGSGNMSSGKGFSISAGHDMYNSRRNSKSDNDTENSHDGDGPTLEAVQGVKLESFRQRSTSRRSSAAMVVVPPTQLEVGEMISDIENEVERPKSAREEPNTPSKKVSTSSLNTVDENNSSTSSIDTKAPNGNEEKEASPGTDDQDDDDGEEDDDDENDDEYTNDWDAEKAALYRINITKEVFRVKGDILSEEELEASPHYITLQALRGPGRNRVARFSSNNISIGNREDNSIAINDRSLSAHHCMIVYSFGAYFLVDRCSQTGTYYSPQMLEDGIPLEAGTRFKLSETEFVTYAKLRESGCCGVQSNMCSLQ